MMRRAALGLLGLTLAGLYPLNFAAEFLSTVPSIGMRGYVAVIELLVHGAIAALSVAAALAVWDRRPHARALATAAIVAVTAATVQSLYWSILPSQTKPGDELLLSAAAIAHAAVWLAFLHFGGEAGASADDPRVRS